MTAPIIQLSVARVTLGGNTGYNKDTNCYEYFHAFSQTNILHEGGAMEIPIKLLYENNNAKNRFQIKSCIFSNKDLFVNIPEPSVCGQYITIPCKAAIDNSMSHIILIVEDTNYVDDNGKPINFCCDPQVINSVPPNE